MKISDIKVQLSIITVLDHYGLKADKNHMLRCPFHPDKTPSLQIYPKTNTYCCFSTNCSAGTGDQIQFIQLKEKSTKHQAIMKAKELLNYVPDISPVTSADHLSRIAVLTKFYQSAQHSMSRSPEGKNYVQQRGLDWKKAAIGFNRKTINESWNKPLQESAFNIGLLKQAPNNTYLPKFYNCLVFALENKERQIVNIYCRSITNDPALQHFYLPGPHQGLYPRYPKSETKKIILTESIIDAATLYQCQSLASHYSIVACYGTNGFTAEHEQVLKDLKELEEIIVFFDGDEAGRKGADKLGLQLNALNPQWKITTVPTPDNEDINSLLQSHEPEIYTHLLNSRKPFVKKESASDSGLSFSNENENTPPPLDTPLQLPTLNSKPITDNYLNTDNTELLVYTTGSLIITILGGIKIAGLDRLRVTLRITHKTNKALLPIRHNLDLYHNSHTEQLINKINEALEISHQEATKSISHLITALEEYRTTQLTALNPPEPKKKSLSQQEIQQVSEYLKTPDLMQRTGQALGAAGIIGEEDNRLIMYLTMTSRKRESPLNIICLGQSGTGKSHLMEKVAECIPEEDIIENTSFSEYSLYYYGKDALKHKLILIEDMDGAENVLYPIRELQSKKRISRTIALKDPKGNVKTVTLKVEGPVCVIGCTTKERVYEDNANRSLLLYVDQSKEQDHHIMHYQKQLSSGQINKAQEKHTRRLLQNIQQILRPIHITNPYANYIDLPPEVFKPRRTLAILLAFIETVTFYHQYQCPVKEEPNTREPYIETHPDHIEWTFKLLKDILFKKADELSGACRGFFEKLKTWTEENNKESFSSKEIRTAFRANPNTLKYHLRELNTYGHLKAIRGNKYRGFEYQIINKEEYNTLKNSIDQKLIHILTQVKEAHNSKESRQVGKSGQKSTITHLNTILSVS